MCILVYFIDPRPRVIQGWVTVRFHVALVSRYSGSRYE